MSLPVDPVPLAVGDAMPPYVTAPMTRTDFVRYAGASGDFHRIHHDEQYALEAGMPSVFGMGMLHAGMLGVRLARWVGPRNVVSFKVRFTGRVWPGDVLTLSGRVATIEPGRSHEVATIELQVVSQRQDTVLVAHARALVAPAACGKRLAD